MTRGNIGGLSSPAETTPGLTHGARGCNGPKRWRFMRLSMRDSNPESDKLNEFSVRQGERDRRSLRFVISAAESWQFRPIPKPSRTLIGSSSPEPPSLRPPVAPAA